MSFIHDDQFGEIVDFEGLRPTLRRVYDAIVPDFNLLKTMNIMSEAFNDSPSHMIAAGASMLAYQMIPAAGEHELAEKLKDSIFTLGWTEEHCGSDLLSIRTAATPASDDPDERNYHISGSKWMINNSFHADYHCVLAKLDPTQDGPRSLSLFLVPHSSTKNWERLNTHVLRNMVLTKFDIDGPGILLGKRGHGLSIVQRMAMPSKYQASYVGMRMVHQAVPEAINWLSTKNIFGEYPVNFTNVFRQLYTLALQAATIEFMYYRAYALNDGSFLQFHGTMLKSFLLMRANEVLAQNLLVAGSKGFTQESIIGRNVIDSFVLPVFDGHYTVNTFMTAKHANRYLHAERQEDAFARLNMLRERLYAADIPHGELDANPRDIRQPDFFDIVDYIGQLDLPLDLDAEGMVNSVITLLEEMQQHASLATDPETKYKTGDLIHYVEAVVAACELWAITENTHYLNAVILQYNDFVTAFNAIVSEGSFNAPFLTPLRQRPLPTHTEDAQAFLLDLCDVRRHIGQQDREPAPGAD